MFFRNDGHPENRLTKLFMTSVRDEHSVFLWLSELTRTGSSDAWNKRATKKSSTNTFRPQVRWTWNSIQHVLGQQRTKSKTKCMYDVRIIENVTKSLDKNISLRMTLNHVGTLSLTSHKLNKNQEAVIFFAIETWLHLSASDLQTIKHLIPQQMKRKKIYLIVVVVCIRHCGWTSRTDGEDPDEDDDDGSSTCPT